jgi:hypothetical protein
MLNELRPLSQAWILAQVLLAVHSGMGKKNRPLPLRIRTMELAQ